MESLGVILLWDLGVHLLKGFGIRPLVFKNTNEAISYLVLTQE